MSGSQKANNKVYYCSKKLLQDKNLVIRVNNIQIFDKTVNYICRQDLTISKKEEDKV